MSVQTKDIYGGKHPATVPFYTIRQAAHYLNLPASTVRDWATGQTRQGEKRSKPLIGLADAKRGLCSFQNLTEIHVLGSIRRAHRVKLNAIRRAVAFLKERFQSEHPLIDQEMLTDGKDLFIEKFGEYVAISDNDQMVMKQIVETFLRRIERDADGPIRLFPFVGEPSESAPRLIVIDPKLQFGKPCIAGTRIPTDIIAERFEAGDSVRVLTEDYELSEAQVEEAIRYERHAAA